MPDETFEAALAKVVQKAEARTLDEVKDVRDKAEALRAYARQAKNRQLEIDAGEIRIRAERKVGTLIEAQKLSGGLAKGTAGKRRPKIGGSESDPPISKFVLDEDEPAQPTLAAAGIDKHLADRARKLAAVKDNEFENKLADWRNDAEAGKERIATDVLKKKTRGTQILKTCVAWTLGFGPFSRPGL